MNFFNSYYWCQKTVWTSFYIYKSGLYLLATPFVLDYKWSFPIRQVILFCIWNWSLCRNISTFIITSSMMKRLFSILFVCKEIIYEVIINRNGWLNYLVSLFIIYSWYTSSTIEFFFVKITDFTVLTSTLLYQRYSIGSHYIYVSWCPTTNKLYWLAYLMQVFL